MNLHKSCRLNDFSANPAASTRRQPPSNLIASQKTPSLGSFCLATDFPPLNLVRRGSQSSSARVSRRRLGSARVSRPRRSRRPVRPWTLDFGLGPSVNRFPRFPHLPPGSAEGNDATTCAKHLCAANCVQRTPPKKQEKGSTLGPSPCSPLPLSPFLSPTL